MVKKIIVPKFKNTTGTISVIEKKIKFKIKRVYFIYNITGLEVVTDKKTKQFLVCLRGKCKLVVLNNKKIKKFNLSSLNYGILLEPNDWHEIKNVSKDAIICVLASEYYSKKDYINEND